MATNCVVALLFLSNYHVTFGMSLFEDQLHGQHETCTSQDCLKIAYEVKRSMNFSVDPCDDFYQFTCGGFLKDAIIPDGKYEIDDLSLRREEVILEGKLLMESDETAEDWDLHKMAKNYYKDCVNITRRNDLGNGGAKELFEKAGGWPLLGATNSKPWFEVQADLFNHGVRTALTCILQLLVFPDMVDSSQMALYIDQPKLEHPQDYYGSSYVTNKLKTFLAKTAIYFGADSEEAKVAANKAVEFEMKLSKIMAPMSERRNHLLQYHPYALNHSLQYIDAFVRFPFDIQTYLNNIGNFGLTENSTVVLMDPEYVKKLGDLIFWTQEETIKDYIFFKAAWSLMPHLDSAAIDIYEEFQARGHNNYKRPPLWRECILQLGFGVEGLTGLSLISSSMFVKNYFDIDSKHQVDEILANEKLALVDLIKSSDWMDNATKTEALLKVSKMKQTMGYNENILNEHAMEEAYANFTLIPEFYMESMLRSNRFIAFFYLDKFGKKESEESWLDEDSSLITLIPNAFYSWFTNRVIFTAAIIRGMSFNAECPRYINYGGIGTIIGHEIGHGFDNKGRMLDSDGSMNNWWSPQTNKIFQEKARCVVDLFNSFVNSQVGMTISGVRTQSENIADILGDRTAYLAYKGWLEENGGDEPSLPGLPFTPQQMFWIAKGRQYCNKMEDSNLRWQIFSGTHTPMEHRINGVVMNSFEFARDFECPSGSSTMNPETKCTFW